MGLRDTLAADAAAFVNVEDFGELVTWFDDGGDEGREIAALVFREEPDTTSQAGGARLHQATMFVTATDVPTPSPKDRVLVALRAGDDPVRCRVTAVLSRDAGGSTVGVAR